MNTPITITDETEDSWDVAGPAPTSSKAMRAWAKRRDRFTEYNEELYGSRGRQFGRLSYLTYCGTMLIPKPDPLGRFLLADIRDDRTYTQLIVPGANAPDEALASIYRNTSGRQHGEPGARVLDLSWGAAAYMASAYANHLWTDRPYVFSFEGNRSELAEDMWDRLLDRGTAKRRTVEEEYEDDVRVCADVEDYEVRSSRDDYGSYTGEICEDVNVIFTESGERDILEATEIRDLLAWPADTSSAATQVWASPRQDSYWSQPGIHSQPFIGDPFNKDEMERALGEMLARAAHGKSAGLAQYICARLERFHPDLAAAYANRPEVRQMLLEVAGQQRLPGLDGLNDALRTKTKMPPLSSKARKLIAKWENMG